MRMPFQNCLACKPYNNELFIAQTCLLNLHESFTRRELKMAGSKLFLAYLRTEKSWSKNTQYKFIIWRTWYGFRDNFLAGTNRVIPVEQDSVDSLRYQDSLNLVHLAHSQR